MWKRQTSSCQRCGAVILRGAGVCTTCCAPQTVTSAPPTAVAQTEPQPAAPSADPMPQTGLSAWPFGQADAEAAAQVAALAAADDVRDELSHYSSQATTHVLGAIPAQRPAQPQEELHSVPSHGPNPFLAAARLQQARTDADGFEG